MATSSLKVNAGLGLLTAITIVIALAIDFLLLPPLLMLRLGETESAEQPTEVVPTSQDTAVSPPVQKYRRGSE